METVIISVLCLILFGCTEHIADSAKSGINDPLWLSGDFVYGPLDRDKGGAENMPRTVKETVAEYGIASYYAAGLHSRKTSSGERLDQRAFTAAHRTLPFATRVRVTNVKNGRSVIVRINDRGPFVRGRVIDLTRAAFGKIANLRCGIIRVKIEVIE